jgi:hypothetical protein
MPPLAHDRMVAVVVMGESGSSPLLGDGDGDCEPTR